LAGGPAPTVMTVLISLVRKSVVFSFKAAGNPACNALYIYRYFKGIVLFATVPFKYNGSLACAL
jgi:hypothetical protein